jgi:DNA polymerase
MVAVRPQDGSSRALDFVRSIAADCRRCPLAAARTRIVFGEGPLDARLLILGEAPGAEEDAAGRPFVGDAGGTLDGLLAEAGVDRDRAYVANVVLSHPPDNRPPTPAEVSACAPYLDLTLAVLRLAGMLLDVLPPSR